ncbi:hypothetical protein EZS27_024269, partial [termite gut metagenome]
AEVLYAEGHKLLLTKRYKSNLWRCSSFRDGVQWTNTDTNQFELDVYSFRPDVIINSAWDGVSAQNRGEWDRQCNNLLCQQRLLNMVLRIGIKKFIGIGSQAEYGKFDGRIDETYLTNPTSAYGAIKLSSSIALKTFCEENNITWHWLRLFSCFGEREAENWLIPVAIKSMLFENSMDLTSCEQQYSYLYIKDMARSFLLAVESDAKNGIYNIASDTLRSLKDILLTIKDYLNPNFQLNFGVLPYRKNQSMINGSINTKAQNTIGIFETSDFTEKLIQTIEYYKDFYDSKR